MEVKCKFTSVKDQKYTFTAGDMIAALAVKDDHGVAVLKSGKFAPKLWMNGHAIAWENLRDYCKIDKRATLIAEFGADCMIVADGTSRARFYYLDVVREGLDGKQYGDSSLAINPDRDLVLSFSNEQDPIAVDDKWINLARSKDKNRPVLMQSAGRCASDGFRLHYDRTIAERPIDGYPDIMQILGPARNNPEKVTVDSADLIAAITSASRINKETIRVHIRRSCIEIIAINEEKGESINELPITNGNEDPIKFAINPKFMIDALKMGSKVTIAAKMESVNWRTGKVSRSEYSERPLYMAAGNREAVIMPKHLG